MPLIDYALNYEKITTELCQNIDKPELLCNGFCYLKEEVKHENNFSKDKAVKNIVKISEAITTPKQEIEKQYSFENFIETSNDSYQNIYKNLLIKIIFHPPIA